MYAQLCKRLAEEAPNFEPPDKPCTFRLLLLNKCRAEFENRSKATEAFERNDGQLTPEEEEERQTAKRKMLGNIKVSNPNKISDARLKVALFESCAQPRFNL